MLQRVTRRMSESEFLDWQSVQQDRYELVDGEPRAMTGARFSHDRVLGNIFRSIGQALETVDSSCDVFTGDIAVRVRVGHLRRPDVAVYCPPFEDDKMVSDRPRLIVEVLSESTQAVDQTIKLQEYMKIAGLIYIILVVPLAVDVQVWSRQDDASWTSIRYTTLSDVIPLPGLSIHLPLQQVYRRANVLQPDPLLEAEDE